MKPSEWLYFAVHPSQLRSIIQWKVWHNPVHERNETAESETQRVCFRFLDQTSRSFSAVIKEVHPELLLPICVFYLVLRGLDTIEDDPSLPLSTKEPLLRGFPDILNRNGWTFDGNRPEEKDRNLLVEFHNVITEFQNLKPPYRVIIQDIAHKMGNGMADYCIRAATEGLSVLTNDEYDLYCHYVAGLVGEGLTRLFVEAKFGNPGLLERPGLHNAMGLFLQKTNIIRDVREDHNDDRHFWPKEIWSKHVDRFEDLFRLEHREAALNCSAEMVLNALHHVDECLFYLAGIREQSIFNFCAIPQSMAIATLELCFRNPAMFDRNVKISRGEACQLMLDSTQNLRVVCEVFRRYARRIHRKNTPKDPNFMKISIACGKIEKFIETLFPSQTAEDARRRVAGQTSVAEDAKRKVDAETRGDMLFMFGILFCVVLVVTVMMIGTAWLMGARFDLAFQELRQGNWPTPINMPPGRLRHGEL
ncbi:Isoprenoid synthase domain containing protein [Elaphomyces granulatus]